MKKDNGLTLIEVLASVVVLAVAILLITTVLQHTASSSRSNAVTDKSVQITRSVLEEIKNNMQKDSISIFTQNVNTKQLREIPAPQQFSIYYPDSSEQQYRLDIRSLALAKSDINLLGKPHELNSYFRRIQVICTNLQTNKTYELEALVEYN